MAIKVVVPPGVEAAAAHAADALAHGGPALGLENVIEPEALRCSGPSIGRMRI